MNRQVPTGKIFTAYIPDKGLESKTHKEFLQTCKKMTNNAINDWNRYQTKEDTYEWPISSEKMLNIITYQGNANYSHNEMPLHIH